MLNPDGPNWRVSHTGADGRATDGNRPSPIINNPTTPGAPEDGPIGEAYLPIGIPTGTGVPTSSLVADNTLPNTNESANQNTK